MYVLGIYGGFKGIMEKNMETTILGFWVFISTYLQMCMYINEGRFRV